MIYVVERQSNGSSRRILATELYGFFSNQNIKVKLCRNHYTMCMINMWKGVLSVYHSFLNNCFYVDSTHSNWSRKHDCQNYIE